MSNRNRNIETDQTDMPPLPPILDKRQGAADREANDAYEAGKVNAGYPASADSTAAERRAEDADIEDFNFADDYEEELPDEEIEKPD
jgi:hypothetical protein